MSETLKDSAPAEARRGVWLAFRELWHVLGMNGDRSVTNRTEERKAFWWAVTGVCLLVTAVNSMNVTSYVHNETPLLAAVIVEGSSWITVMLFCWIPWVAVQIAPVSSPPWRLLSVHVVGALLFSACHVGGFELLRKLGFGLAGHPCRCDAIAAFPYELRKDALGYVLIAALFLIMPRVVRGGASAGAGNSAKSQRVFVIRDGARVTRVKLEDVLAVASAGNYVEFNLKDGRKLLMRSSLSAVEAELEPNGFLRTHRSWLVNAAHVGSLKPEGSGDYGLEVGPLRVPLSRRFPQALAALRAP
ncbi:MAG: LytTR family DNA-binding domain-containing protein [Alphaproteobacteria bacterium]